MKLSQLTLVLFTLSFFSAKIIEHGKETCLKLTPSPFLEKFVDALPEIPEINLKAFPSIRIGAYKIQQILHRDLPTTTLYAFGTSWETATYPGPTLIAEEGCPARVHWENHIMDTEHLFPIDPTLHWANPRSRYIPIVVHLHGHESPPQYDGHTNAWFNAVGETGSTFVSQEYVYPNMQAPSTMWYHDHTVGITRLNVAAGLVGVYILHSPRKEPKWMPSKYHVLVIQDKAFYGDGYIKYSSVGINPRLRSHWCPDYIGDVVLVNGMAWPHLDVAPKVYRFKLLNAANSRFYNLRLNHTELKFFKIGTDGGYLKTPVLLEQVTVGPAERAEFLLDFSRLRPNTAVEVTSTGPEPFTLLGVNITVSVMQFRVRIPAEPGPEVNFPEPLTSSSMRAMKPLELIRQTSGVDLSNVDWNAIYYRPLVQNIVFDSNGGIDTFFLNDRYHFNDTPTEVVKTYTEEVWSFINTVIGAHTIHIHLVNFLVLEQQPFKVSFVNGTCTFDYDYPDPRSCYNGPAELPDPDMLGPKDTALLKPLYVSRFFVAFRPSLPPRFQIDPTQFPGYLWHCHLLEHEDNEMMRPLVLTNNKPLYTNASFSPVNLY